MNHNYLPKWLTLSCFTEKCYYEIRMSLDRMVNFIKLILKCLFFCLSFFFIPWHSISVFWPMTLGRIVLNLRIRVPHSSGRIINFLEIFQIRVRYSQWIFFHNIFLIRRVDSVVYAISLCFLFVCCLDYNFQVCKWGLFFPTQWMILQLWSNTENISILNLAIPLFNMCPFDINYPVEN